MTVVSDVEIRLRADIARLRQDLQGARREVTNAIDDMSSVVNRFKGVLGGMLAGFGLTEIARMSDAYSKFTAQLKLATDSQTEYNNALASVKTISNTAKSSLENTAVLYARIANGTKELGISQSRVADITETVSLALRVSGATAAESGSAMLQLSQAFASGTLRGEEFNAVNEAAPRLMKALADGIGQPIGALRGLAENGKLTSEVLASALPRALEDLRKESTSIETISGAFQVLRDRVMEFTAIQAQSSGAVSTFTSALGFLADNLTTLAQLLITAGAAKFASMLSAWTVASYAQARANITLNATALAQAQAQTAVTAATLATTTARVAELRAAILAADGDVALAIALNGLIPAQTRATAAAAAHTAALAAQATAARAASVSAGLASRALGLFGGPVGLVVTLLGVAATAWSYFGSKSEEANKVAADATVASTGEVVAQLQKQIAKLEERNRLFGKAPDVARAEGPAAEKQREILRQIDETNKNSNLTLGARTEIVRALTMQYGQVTNAVYQLSQAQAENDKNMNGDKLTTWLAKNTQYLSDAEKLANTIAAAKKDLGDAYSDDVEQRIRRVAAAHGDAGKASDAAAAAAKKEQSSYAGLIVSIKEKIAADQMEIAGGVALTDGQKLRVKIDEELRAGKISLTKEHIKEIHAMLDSADAMEKNAAAAKQVREAVKVLADERDKNYQALVSEASANEGLAATYGKTKLQIMQMTQARDEDRLSQRAALDLSEDTVAQLQREIEARRRNIAAMGTLDVLEQQKKASEDAAAAQVSFWKSIDDTAHSTFVSILDGSKDTAQRLKDTFKNVFFDWLYQMTIKKWLINISTATTATGASGLASAADGSGGAMSVVSLYNSAKSAYSAITNGFGSIASGATEAVQTALNTLGVNSGYYSAAGSGMPASGLASGAGAAAGIAAGVVGGVYGGRAISGQYGNNSTVNAGTAIGAAIGSVVPVVGTALGALVGGLLGGVANRLFGMGEKKVQSTMIEGSLTATGATGSNIANWTQKGGWFRSNKSGTDTSALTSEQSTAFSSTYKAILDVSKVLGDTIGASTDALATRVQKLSIDFTGLSTDAEKLGAVTKFFEGVADSVAVELVPSLKDFQLQGESLSATMQRVVVNYAQVKDILASVDKTIGAVGAAGVKTTESLIAAAGGLDALASGVAYFQQNFYTDAQKLEKAQTQVAAAMSEIGFASVKTNEQFKAATLGIDLTTQAGAELFAKMLALAPVFKQVTDAADAAAAAQAELAAEQAKAAIEAAQAAAKAAEELAKAQAAAILKGLQDNEALLRSGVTASYDQLQRAVAARKDDLADAYNETIKGIEAGIAAINASGAIKRALSEALKGGLVGVSSAGAASGSLTAAQAQLAQALATAQRSGVLPSADSLKDALAAVGRDNSDQFASLLEYQRSVAKTNSDISALGGITDQQLTVQERQLIALNAQKDAATAAYQAQIARLDSMLEYHKMQSDLALGQYQQLVSVNAGIGGVAAAIAALKSGATTSNPTGTGLTLEGLYQAVLGRAPDAAGAAFWSNVFGSAIDSTEYAQFVQGAQAELASRANDWSTNPAYAPASSNSSTTAIDTLNTQMAGMQSAMNRTAAATAQLADQFSKVSGNGNALLTESLV